jgi:hypothetical protein
MEATASNHLPIVSFLLEKGANPNHESRSGWTPLLIACKAGYADIAMRLIAGGARIDAKEIADEYCCPLLVAAKRGHARVVAELVRAGMRLDIPVTPQTSSPGFYGGYSNVFDMAIMQQQQQQPQQQQHQDHQNQPNGPLQRTPSILHSANGTTITVIGQSREYETQVQMQNEHFDSDAADMEMMMTQSYLARIFDDLGAMMQHRIDTDSTEYADLCAALLQAGARTDLSMPPCTRYMDIMMHLALVTCDATLAQRLFHAGARIDLFAHVTRAQWRRLMDRGFKLLFMTQRLPAALIRRRSLHSRSFSSVSAAVAHTSVPSPTPTPIQAPSTPTLTPLVTEPQTPPVAPTITTPSVLPSASLDDKTSVHDVLSAEMRRHLVADAYVTMALMLPRSMPYNVAVRVFGFLW